MPNLPAGVSVVNNPMPIPRSQSYNNSTVPSAPPQTSQYVNQNSQNPSLSNLPFPKQPLPKQFQNINSQFSNQHQPPTQPLQYANQPQYQNSQNTSLSNQPVPKQFQNITIQYSNQLQNQNPQLQNLLPPYVNAHGKYPFTPNVGTPNTPTNGAEGLERWFGPQININNGGVDRRVSSSVKMKSVEEIECQFGKSF